jgi:integrase
MIGKTKEGVFFYSVRYTDALGERKQKYQQDKSWRTKKEVREAMESFLSQVKPSVKGLTMDGLFDAFIKDADTRLKQSTVYNYKAQYRYIQPTFGSMEVEKITPRMIQSWQGDLMRKGYTNGTMSVIQTELKMILAFGVRNQLIHESPFLARTVSDKNQRKEEVEYWTPKEFAQFIDRVDNPIYAAFFKTLYWTGIRRGEAIALTCGDIDLVNGTLRVNKTYNSALKTTTSPKTRNSYRVVQLTDDMRTTLKTLVMAWQTKDDYEDGANLFGFSHPISVDGLAWCFHRAARLAGVKQIKVHALRHSHVSLLIHMGFSPFEIAKRMGHSVSMVQDVYGHWFTDSQNDMTARLNDVQRSLDQPKTPTS